MRKKGAFILLILLFVSVFSLIFAIAENETSAEDLSSTAITTSMQQNLSKIDSGFKCLEDKLKTDCSGATTIQEIALSILATPKSSILSECKSKLLAKKSSQNCWPSNSCNVKETALAILALNHLGENTDEAENWILNQTKTPIDLIWYLEQDSNEASECNIKYNSNDYKVNIGEDKKINSNAGSCLTRAVSNFWLQIASSCFNEEFQVSCDKNFISTLLYKNKNSPTIYVLSNTESSPAFGTISLKIKSKCFGISSCDYESTAWATIALLKTNHNIGDYIPYLIALGDTNKRYLPNSFIFMATNYEDYGNKLVEEQKLGNYWEASSSAYGRYYDTALALLALPDSTGEKIIKAKDWLLFSQASNGCWQNSIRDTAIILWALAGRTYSGGGSSITYCTTANYFCIPTADCSSGQELPNYYCSGTSSICCQTENLQSCSAYLGLVCNSNQICSGNERRASDTDNCCLGECIERPTTTECEDMTYSCRASCLDTQEEVPYTCNSGDICCRTKTTPASSNWWIWLIIILIILILGVLAFIFRDRLKLFFFKLKSKFKKDKSPPSNSNSGFPPRPGFPPVRRMPPMQMRRQMPAPVRRGGDSAMDDVFKRLKEMSK